jgi:pimeloyl-ACP methyl ester carboxylesterase
MLLLAQLEGTMNANDWRAKGAHHNVRGRSLFVADTGVDGGEDKPTLVLLHGYPTSSHDYFRVLDALAAHYRVIVHDHLGFGLSDKPRDYSYSLIEQADVALLLWQQLGVTSAHVFAHDYGTSVGTELLARWNLGFRPVHHSRGAPPPRSARARGRSSSRHWRHQRASVQRNPASCLPPLLARSRTISG